MPASKLVWKHYAFDLDQFIIQLDLSMLIKFIDGSIQASGGLFLYRNEIVETDTQQVDLIFARKERDCFSSLSLSTYTYGWLLYVINGVLNIYT